MPKTPVVPNSTPARPESGQPQTPPPRTRPSDLAALCALTAAALLVHGYHGMVEDAEIYLPGVLKHLDPTLFPTNTGFFASHAGMTLFPGAMAASIRLSHLPVEAAMFAWHLATTFVLLLACWRVARLCFRSTAAAWTGVATVAALLTIPVAGTALYVMDQYVTPRSFSTAASMLALADLLERRRWRATLSIAVTAALHPLMALFTLVFAALLLIPIPLPRRVPGAAGAPAPIAAAFLLPWTALFPPVSSAYREALKTHPYFLLTNWAWYEWLGLLAPFALFYALNRWARRSGLDTLARLARAVIVFEGLFLAMAMLVSMPGPFERFSELQPMRCLLLVYVLLFLFAGALAERWIFRGHMWRRLMLLAPLSTGMFAAQLALFPATPHIEWPGAASPNRWVQAFDWVRTHTPRSAYFALDPNYERLQGEDVHGFRAIARRSMLADNGKDGGAVSMFPALAGPWRKQLESRRNWSVFDRADFSRLKATEGVDWVVLEQPGSRGLSCPYSNERILVCRID